MASGTTEKPYVPYVQGTWEVGSNPKCTLSTGNMICRVGDMGFAKVIITAWSGGGSSSSETRTLYTNISILPRESVSYGVAVKNNNSLQTACININTNGTITFYNDGAFTGGIVRAYIPFPCQ